jgi:hypothetical protein
MSIKSIKAEFGNTVAFLGGATALNLLGGVSKTAAIPNTWEKKINEFLGCGDGNSFNLGGNEIIKTGLYVKAKGITFKETEHGDKGPAYWEIAENLANTNPQTLAATSRVVLEYPGTKCGPWEATLIAAMFLSEVVRNPRSFTVNLMLLDLIESRVKYGKAATKELDFSKLLKFGGSQGGKTATYTYSSPDGPREVKVGGDGGQAGTVRGGKLPMSHLNAMDQYQKSLAGGFEYKDKYKAYAKQSDLNLKAPDSAGVAYHFPNELLEKECTVVLRWLLAYFAKKPLQYVTGSEQREVTVKGVWGKKDTTQVMKIEIKANAVLTGLRQHVCDNGWIDVSTAQQGTSPAKFKSECARAIESRQGCVNNLLG